MVVDNKMMGNKFDDDDDPVADFSPISGTC